MNLNIDLGTLYTKVAIIDDERGLIKSEIIKMEKNTLSVVESLITNTVNIYKEQYPITKINIIPNLEYVEYQLINSEAIVSSKYQQFIKDQIKKEIREKKKQVRMGSDYRPPEETDSLGYKDLDFAYNLLEYEIFNGVENTTIMETNILLEYVDIKYLKFLNSAVTRFGKEVSVISPIRALRNLPFPKESRIIIDYGYKYIQYCVIDEDDKIIHVDKERVDLTEDTSSDSMLYKHSQIANTSPIYNGVMNRIQEIRNNYQGYKLYTIGGNANYLQDDLSIINKFEYDFFPDKLPLQAENVLVGSGFTNYRDLQYNTIQMNLKNRIFGIFNSTSTISNNVVAIAGDITIALLILTLVSGYKVNSSFLKYKSELQGNRSRIESYTGSDGLIVNLEDELVNLQEGKIRTYYNIAELIKSIESPLEIESIKVEGDNISMVAYADNTALIYQFLNTVKIRQSENYYTNFTLKERDIQTVYRNGGKLDRVEFTGRIN